MTDPNPAVAGRGIEQLRAAGLQVEIGLGKIEAQKLNEAFCKWISTRRPLLTLKSALTLDGQIALPTPRRHRPRQKTVTWITSEESRSEVQRLRHAAELGRREILSALLEAGGELNAAALAAGVVDKMFLFYAPRMAGSNHRGVVQTQGRAFRVPPALKNLSLHRFGPDFAVEGYLRDVYRNR
ncbi:MAG: hypothetical protein DMG29_07115 [Acidobacteria bacterium]|nr:MAG: hypothetical protein DMG29_07115 [Acidobacteriota bacterium]